MHIGGLKPYNNVFLAPMAGVTDLPMRELAIETGAGLAVGEMLSADPSLAQTLKTQLRQQHSDSAGIRAIQIVGYEPAQLANAARFNVALGADMIDINMGCPAKKVCRRAAGSALLADEQLVEKILTAVVDAVPVPVTLKIRTGTDHEHRNGTTIARIAEQAGVQMLTVHGRTRADRFKGSAEYDTIAAIVDAVSIPVIANGDIDSADKAKTVLNQTGAAGVMIGRAAQGQLWLPGAIARALEHRSGDHSTHDIRGHLPELTPSVAEQLALHTRHLSRLHTFYGDFLGTRISRKHHAWFLTSLVTQNVIEPQMALEQRQQFNQLSNPATQDAALQRLSNNLLGIDGHMAA
jgi:tRNA-dihydrouridine synthase B